MRTEYFVLRFQLIKSRENIILVGFHLFLPFGAMRETH